MLTPSIVSPRLTALKFAVVALSREARRDLREALAHGVPPAPGRITTWADVVRAAIAISSPADQAWIRIWVRRWTDQEGNLAIPGAQRGDGLIGRRS